jgi:hypothetical protein
MLSCPQRPRPTCRSSRESSPGTGPPWTPRCGWENRLRRLMFSSAHSLRHHRSQALATHCASTSGGFGKNDGMNVALIVIVLGRSLDQAVLAQSLARTTFRGNILPANSIFAR